MGLVAGEMRDKGRSRRSAIAILVGPAGDTDKLPGLLKVSTQTVTVKAGDSFVVEGQTAVRRPARRAVTMSPSVSKARA